MANDGPANTTLRDWATNALVQVSGKDSGVESCRSLETCIPSHPLSPVWHGPPLCSV